MHASSRELPEEEVQDEREWSGRPRASSLVHGLLAAIADDSQSEREELPDEKGGSAVRARLAHRLPGALAHILHRSHAHVAVVRGQRRLLPQGARRHRRRDRRPRDSAHCRRGQSHQGLQGRHAAQVRQRARRVLAALAQGTLR